MCLFIRLFILNRFIRLRLIGFFHLTVFSYIYV